MANSYSSSRTSCMTFSRSRNEESEVTLDDVAAVVAGLNSKVMQLRRDILSLRDSPRLKKTDERAGYGNGEDGKTKMELRELYERKDEDNVGRRRKSSEKSMRKKSKSRKNEHFIAKNEYHRSSSTPVLSDDISTKQKYSSQQTRKNSSDHGKRQQKLIQPDKRDEFNVSGKTTKGRSTSESSGRILSNDAKHETTQTFVKPKRKSKIFGQVFDEKSTLESSKNRATSSRDRKHYFSNQYGGSSGVKEISSNSENSKHHYLEENSMTDTRRRSRIIMPSRVSTECQGIRHALGLSTAHCNCIYTGSAVRRVRRKRISRGIQCDQLNDNKKKRSSGLGACFAFKCCVAKPDTYKRKSSRNSEEKQKDLDSSDAYKPSIDKYEGEIKMRPRENRGKGNEEIDTTRNRRIGGGGGKIISQRFKHGEARSPRFFENVNTTQSYPYGIRREEQALMDRWIQKNDVTDVKRRLNECLIELNGIIGDVGFIFKENNEHR